MTIPPYSQYAQPEPEPEPQPRLVRIRRPRTTPRVTYILLGVTVFVYLLQTLTQMGIAREPFLALGRLLMGSELLDFLISRLGGRDLLILLGGKISPLIVEGQLWRLFTPALLHASVPHIAFNMYALYAIGPTLESSYGHWRFLALYLLGAFGGNVLSFWMTPNISVGASTAIFGLVAAQGVFIYQNRRLFGAQARAMLNNVIFIVVINLALGLTGGIDNWGHLGGLIAGLAFAWFGGPRLEVEYTAAGYELTDARSQGAAWLAAAALAFAIGALALLRINQG